MSSWSNLQLVVVTSLPWVWETSNRCFIVSLAFSYSHTAIPVEPLLTYLPILFHMAVGASIVTFGFWANISSVLSKLYL
ncbi:MAG TPA: hypothetical protein VF941_03370 [Clostridia bacterium]